MNVKADRIAAGKRFKINKFGATRCPSLAEKSGVVIGCSRSNSGGPLRRHQNTNLLA